MSGQILASRLEAGREVDVPKWSCNVRDLQTDILNEQSKNVKEEANMVMEAER